MLLKTADLTGAALNWAVAKAEGYKPLYPNFPKGALTRGEKSRTWDDGGYIWLVELNYSNNWRLAGPIIERENITVYRMPGGVGGEYRAEKPQSLQPGVRGSWYAAGSTYLEAAMRCYVAAKIGEEVDVPEELLGD